METYPTEILETVPPLVKLTPSESIAQSFSVEAKSVGAGSVKAGSKEEVEKNYSVEGIQDWLVAKLAQLLDLRDDISITVPLSRYGLDSANTMVLTSDLIDWLGLEIEPDTIFQYPTVQTLATHLRDRLSRS